MEWARGPPSSSELRRGPVPVDPLDAGDAELRDLGEERLDDRGVRVVGVDEHGEGGVAVGHGRHGLILPLPGLHVGQVPRELTSTSVDSSSPVTCAVMWLLVSSGAEKMVSWAR